jgi:hypothetical protein
MAQVFPSFWLFWTHLKRCNSGGDQQEKINLKNSYTLDSSLYKPHARVWLWTALFVLVTRFESVDLLPGGCMCTSVQYEYD